MRFKCFTPSARDIVHHARDAAAIDKNDTKLVDIMKDRVLMGDLDASEPKSDAAIVFFHDKHSATLPACVTLWNKASEWKVESVAETKGVNWDVLGVA